MKTLNEKLKKVEGLLSFIQLLCTIGTIVFLILTLCNLRASAQITGTYKLVKTLDTYTMEWLIPSFDWQVTLIQYAPDTLEYTVKNNGQTQFRGKTRITGSNGTYWISTDFYWYYWKTRMFVWQDSLTTSAQLYNTDIHYWKKIPFVEKLTAGIEEPVISANIRPNPATDFLVLPYDAVIYNETGMFVLSGPAGRVDISHLPNGIYFAKSLQDSNLIVKFVKQ